MLNEKLIRPLLFIAVAAIHVVLLLFLNFTIKTVIQETPESARVMRVTDFDEAPPPPPPPPPPPRTNIPEVQEVEAIAEIMIETEVVPEQTIVAPGTLTTTYTIITEPSWDDYLPIHRVSQPPQFDERDIAAALIYPSIALRSAIEGRVVLELFVDRNGVVQRITILREDPEDRGFGEAAVRAFTGRVGTPAMANGEPVSTRYRYPVSFRIR